MSQVRLARPLLTRLLKNGLPAILALAVLGAVLMASRGILRSAATVRGLFSMNASGAGAQGDLQYYMQESRHSLDFALSATDPALRQSRIDQTRAADKRVDQSLAAFQALDLPQRARADLLVFLDRWKRYQDVHNEAISQALAGDPQKAAELESGSGAELFESAAQALQSVRRELEADQAGTVGNTIRGVQTELSMLVAVLMLFTWVLFMNYRKHHDHLVREQEKNVREQEKNEALARAQTLERNRATVLELAGRNEPLEAALEAVVSLIELQLPGSIAAVSVFRDGQLSQVVAPHLPADYIEGLYRLPADAGSGSSWAAVERREAVLSAIDSDPIWERNRQAALAHGLRSCWSHPALSNLGQAIGTVDVYYRDAAPPPSAAELLRGAAQLAAIVIQHRRLYEQLSFQAQRDPLTELPNRRLFQDRLEQALLRARREHEHVALLMIDLDRFKQVNDLLGHRTGDSILRIVARRLSECVRQSDTVARIGGDEFTVILNSVADAEAAGATAQKLLEDLRKPVSEQDDAIISASVGISMYPEDGTDPATLVRNADLAMYHVKSRGKGGCQHYAPEFGAKILQRMNIEKSMEQALQNQEFSVHYQAQTDFQRGMVGMEALVRWTSPTLGIVSPDIFIPVAEETGLIVALGTWVLNQACTQIAGWLASGYRPPRVAVNISARQLAQADFADTIRSALERSAIPPGILELELTESAFMHNLEECLERLHAVRALGVCIAIDDFGTGYSSLNYLQKLPVNSLKIDQSFVREISGDSKSTVPVIQAIVELAHGLGLSVVAEGVETEAQFHALRAAGCDTVQGYLMHKPRTAAEIGALLRDDAEALTRLDQHLRAEAEAGQAETPHDGSYAGSGNP